MWGFVQETPSDVIDNLNWDLLKEQRDVLREVITERLSDSKDRQTALALDGILFLLDNLLDAYRAQEGDEDDEDIEDNDEGAKK